MKFRPNFINDIDFCFANVWGDFAKPVMKFGPNSIKLHLMKFDEIRWRPGKHVLWQFAATETQFLPELGDRLRNVGASGCIVGDHCADSDGAHPEANFEA